MVTVCYSWTGSQGACTTWCPAPSSPDRRGRSSWTSVALGRSRWLRYSSARGCWGWGYRRSSETRDKKDCFSWINKVQMRFDHHVSDTVVAYMLGRGRGSWSEDNKPFRIVLLGYMKCIVTQIKLWYLKWEEKVVWGGRSNEARGTTELFFQLPWIQWW